MDIILALRPKNMSVREVIKTSTGMPLSVYVFNSIEYMHIGTWPPQRGLAGFHVPIFRAEVVSTGQDITQRIKKFSGPRHVVTTETVRWSLGRWSTRPRFRIERGRFGIVFEPFYIVPDDIPVVRVINILGQESTFGAK